MRLGIQMIQFRSLVRHALVLPIIFMPGLMRLMLAFVPKRFRPHSLFLLYPGSPAELPGYCPTPLLPIIRTRLFWSRPVPLGIILIGRRPVSIVMGVPNDQKRLLADKAQLELILSRIQAARHSFGAERVALAGQLPSIILRQGLSHDPSIVKGVAGAVFIVTACLQLILERHGFGNDARIVVFGAGLVGSALIGHLQAKGHNAVGIDKMPRGTAVFPANEAGSVLAKADVVVLLSARGSDFRPYVSSLKNGAVILDDTHPPFPRERVSAARGKQSESFTYYKAVATHSELRTVPSLPGFDADWLPGCALEGIVMAETGVNRTATQAEFDAAAERLGFEGKLAS